jgi:hypothetical protein
VASVQFVVSAVVIVFVVFFCCLCGDWQGVGCCWRPGVHTRMGGVPSLLDVLVAVCWGVGGN